MTKHMIGAILVPFLILTMPTEALSQVQKEETVGFVLDIVNNWVSNNEPLMLGQQVSAGAKVAVSPAASKTTPARITIVLLNNEVRTASCTMPNECVSIRLPSRITAGLPLNRRMLEAVMLIFSRRPDRYVLALSRGSGGEDLTQDGVLELRNNEIRIGELLLHLRGSVGLLILRFVPMRFDEKATGNSAAESLTIRIGPENAFTVPAKGFTEGLYQVSVLDPIRPDHPSTDLQFWALITSSADFDTVSSTFTNYRKMTDNWHTSTETGVQRSFLRAVLYDLSRQSDQ